MIVALSATVDLLGQLLVEKGVVAEADYYDRVIQVVGRARELAKDAPEGDAWDRVEEGMVTCNFCGQEVPAAKTESSPVGPVCLPCHAKSA